MNWSNQSAGSPPARRWLGVAQRLLADIEGGVYAPGEALPSDRFLAPEFQVARGTVREALLALELIGALEMRHGSGTYVRERWGRLQPEILHDQWQVQPDELIATRRVLEPAVVTEACRHASAQALADLRADVEQAARLASRPEALPRFVALGLRFHADLAALSGNTLLASFVSQVVDLECQPIWVLLNQHAMREEAARREQVTEHFEIVDCIERGDVTRVETAITQHLDGLRDKIVNPTWPSAPEGGP